MPEIGCSGLALARHVRWLTVRVLEFAWSYLSTAPCGILRLTKCGPASNNLSFDRAKAEVLKTGPV